MVSKRLRTWFVIHFAVDMVFAIPLLLAPRLALTLFGFETVDPFTARLAGAALLAIGLESLLGRNAGADVYRAMLNLKVFWSSAAMVGIIWTIIEGAPASAWIFLSLFAIFFTVWLTYRLRLTRASSQPNI